MSDKMEVASGNVINLLQRFSDSFKTIRSIITEMSDEQLIELFERTKEISNVSWFIRCIILGTAHDRAVRGDKTLLSLAKEFGIGRRAAELDVQVYNTFVKNNPDFEPILPAAFYQIAARASSPEEAIGRAIVERTQNPAYPIAAFRQTVSGGTAREPLSPGLYILVPKEANINELIEEALLDEEGVTHLYGKTRMFSVGGYNYLEFK